MFSVFLVLPTVSYRSSLSSTSVLHQDEIRFVWRKFERSKNGLSLSFDPSSGIIYIIPLFYFISPVNHFLRFFYLFEYWEYCSKLWLRENQQDFFVFDRLEKKFFSFFMSSEGTGCIVVNSCRFLRILYRFFDSFIRIMCNNLLFFSINNFLK